ncbi:metallophosphoesterase [Cystobacter fuscus]|uniref:metallophosphoesterase n=1 Tax=Cystobacter fuscus TaxID=43 RepID=UPI002B292274|nr:metallophosphoesterase [Cystobacter fuscus]
MSRLIFFVLIQLGAWLVLRRLWPEVRAGWRRRVLLGLAVFSGVALVLPWLLGHGTHGGVPWVDAPLRLFGSAWTISALIVLLLGWPLAIVLSRRELARQKRAADPAAPPLPGGVDLERRGLLSGVGRALPFVAVGTSTVGLVEGASGFVIREVEVRLRGLPRALDGFRIGQITDVHVGTFIDTTYVRAAVAAMNAARVDLQVMTGDLIDDLSQLDETMAALETCEAPHGMLAILGNHEHWRGVEEVLEGYARSARRGGPVRLLVDEAQVIEHAGQKVRVVGVDYPMRGRSMSVQADRMQRSAEVAFAGASADEVIICLTHHPSFFPLALEKGARLTLAGHTHGGQVAIWGLPVFWFAFDYMLGRYRKGDGQLYVSGGTGHWLPFRLGVPAEVTLLTLRAEG